MVTRPPAVPLPAADVPKFRPRACARCSSSKLKCNWVSEPGEAPCERCARSKTECILPSLKPRGPRRGNPTRVGQLEQKIDGIMSLLTASQQIQRTSPSAQPFAPSTPSDGPDIREIHPGGPASSVPHSPDPLLPQYHQPGTPVAMTPATTTPLISHRSSFTAAPGTTPGPQQPILPSFQTLRVPPLEHVEIIPGFKITFHDAEVALADYRRLCSPFFPFIPLPHDMLAHEFEQKQPLLFRVVVLAVLPQSSQVQWDARRWFREQLSLRVVVQEEKNVGMLQAALCSLAWSEFGYYLEPRTTPILQLAMGLVNDLGLQKPPSSWLSIPGRPITEAARSMVTRGIMPRRDHTLVDMRSVLGCYYISAMSASLCRRSYALPYSAYLDHCCSVLLEAREYESDMFLVALVRLQRLAYRIYTVLPNPDTDPAPAWSSYAPMFMSIKAIRRELDELVESQPAEVKNHFALWTHYRAIVIRLYEPAVYMRAAETFTMDPTDAAERTTCLWSCLEAVQAFFNAHLAAPLMSLSLLPFPSTVQLSFGIITAMRLLFLMDDPDWDVVRARQSFDFAALSLRIEEQLRAAEDMQDRLGQDNSSNTGSMGRKRRYVYEENRTMLSVFCDRLRQIRQWYLSKLSAEQHGTTTTTTGPSESVASSRGPTEGGRNSMDPLSVQSGSGSSFMDVDNGTGGGGLSDDDDVTFWKSILSMDVPWDTLPFS